MNGLMMIVAVAALVISVMQIRGEIRRTRENDRSIQERFRQVDAREREISREASAKAMYMDFLKLSFENPEIAIAIYDKETPAKKEQYDTYVSLMMLAFEEMLQHDPQNQWRLPVKYSVGYHIEYLKTILDKDLAADESWRSSYDPKLVGIFDEVVEEAKQGDSA